MRGVGRSLTTRLVLTLALGIVTALPVESRAAQVTLRCPRTVRDAQQLPVEVTIDAGSTPLGAYSITVKYDAGLLAVASVTGGNTTEFAGTPTSSTPAPGKTNIAALQAASLTSPAGEVSIAKVTFDVVGTPTATTAVGVAVNQLFGTDGKAFARATGTGCSISSDRSRAHERR